MQGSGKAARACQSDLRSETRSLSAAAIIVDPFEFRISDNSHLAQDLESAAAARRNTCRTLHVYVRRCRARAAPLESGGEGMPAVKASVQSSTANVLAVLRSNASVPDSEGAIVCATFARTPLPASRSALLFPLPPPQSTPKHTRKHSTKDVLCRPHDPPRPLAHAAVVSDSDPALATSSPPFPAIPPHAPASIAARANGSTAS